MSTWILILLAIVGVGAVVLVIGWLLKSIFSVETPKSKDKKKISISKIILQLCIIIYFVCICYFKPIHNSMVSASLLMSGAYSLIYICFSRDLFETVRAIFLGIVSGFCSSFIIGFISIFSDDINVIFNNFSLILLCIAGLSSIFSSGKYLSNDFFEPAIPIEKDIRQAENKNRKITATTYDYGLFKETTYKDEDGNKTTVEHWKF